MDDFNRDQEFYNNIPEDEDLGELASYLMLVTNALKSINFENNTAGGQELMMKIFNMTNLELKKENETALNVIMALLSHIYAMLIFMEHKDEYFKFFDESVIYEILEKVNKK